MMRLEHLPWTFIRAFLGEEKMLLHKSEVNYLKKIPKLNMMPCEDLWLKVKNDNDVKVYFDNSSSKYPGIQYLLDVWKADNRYYTIRKDIVLFIIRNSYEHRKKTDSENVEVRVSDNIFAFLKNSDQVIPSRIDKGAKKATPQK